MISVSSLKVVGSYSYVCLCGVIVGFPSVGQLYVMYVMYGKFFNQYIHLTISCTYPIFPFPPQPCFVKEVTSSTLNQPVLYLFNITRMLCNEER